jgi:hypothetical protein
MMVSREAVLVVAYPVVPREAAVASNPIVPREAPIVPSKRMLPPNR